MQLQRPTAHGLDRRAQPHRIMIRRGDAGSSGGYVLRNAWHVIVAFAGERESPSGPISTAKVDSIGFLGSAKCERSPTIAYRRRLTLSTDDVARTLAC